MLKGKHDIRWAYRQDRLADEYLVSRYENDPLGRAIHGQQVRILRRIFSSHRVRSLLEVAPGPARLTVHVPGVEFACAVEQSPAMLRIAEDRLRSHGGGHWRLIRGDAFRLAFDAARFDFAMSFKLIRHFARPERMALLAELRRVLHPGGHFLIDVANEPANRWLYAKWGLTERWIDDHWFTARGFEEEMEEAGFLVVRMYPVYPAVRLQYYSGSYLGRLHPGAASAVSRALGMMTSSFPCEWIALCLRA